jgi:hypothetical protein
MADQDASLPVMSLAASEPVAISKDIDANATSNPVYVQLSDGTSAIGITSGAIDVNVANTSIAVTATDLDIRDLTHVSDSVSLGDGTNTADFVVLNSAYSSTATVFPIAGKYEATPTTYGDGDAVPLLTDANGKLITVTSITIPAEKVDDSAFTVGTDYVNVGGYLADETTPDSVDEGDVGAARMTLDRKQLMVIADPDTDANRLAIDSNGFITSIISGTVSVDSTGLDVTVINGAGTAAVYIQDGGNSITVDGTVAATQSGVWNIGTVGTITGEVSINDGGNVISVDGTVAATQSGTWNIGTVGGITGTVAVEATDLDIRDITRATDSIQVSKDTAANSESNPIYVYNVGVVTSGTEIHDYDTAAAVGSGSTDNHDYTITSGKTFLLHEVMAAASGAMKIEVQVGVPGGPTTKAVGFTSMAHPTLQLTFHPALEQVSTGTEVVRVIRTNREWRAQDLYSTIIGNETA